MRRKVPIGERLWLSVQGGERRVIRIMVLASVLLVVMQFSVVRDPLQFYISVASKVESPPLDLPSLAPNQSVKLWRLTLKANPAAPIPVLQNGKELATLSKGEQQILAQTGQIQLDGRGLSQIIRVQILKNNEEGLIEPHQTQIIVLPGSIQTFQVSP
ncbi:hypothetical protein Desaci_1802 [Desulfosporosinus acidiphilus SJ4]|uniref:Uncharacterized protein n=1 Tax=Desulfosporosinus acidiphilus (strain DSM 22704 / JCM 16185 / SJ4) TaxID=646529 RepID=I4D4R5_DESAJ|nr:hypothetical protein [Desulfosporosinus acidiphilus]AFM40789.1 hypothetical protein Desaci_1802 [Desulfosporosinus acidiphilus SJ4]